MSVIVIKLKTVKMIRKYHLEIEFDFDTDVSYYEVQIVSSLESDSDFYLAVGTQEEKNTLVFNVDHEQDTDSLTTSEIIQKIMDDINNYHQK